MSENGISSKIGQITSQFRIPRAIIVIFPQEVMRFKFLYKYTAAQEIVYPRGEKRSRCLVGLSNPNEINIVRFFLMRRRWRTRLIHKIQSLTGFIPKIRKSQLYDGRLIIYWDFGVHMPRRIIRDRIQDPKYKLRKCLYIFLQSPPCIIVSRCITSTMAPRPWGL